MKKEKMNTSKYDGPSHKPKLEVITPELVEKVNNQMDKLTEELIDLDMTIFCQRVEKENVGQLRVIRLFLEQKMEEVNNMSAIALSSQTVTAQTMMERQRLAAIFALLARIESKRGFIDHLLISRAL